MRDRVAPVLMDDTAEDALNLEHDTVDSVDEVGNLRQINPVLEYTLRKIAMKQDVTISCLHHIELSGRFAFVHPANNGASPTGDNLEEIGADRLLEDEWRHAYDVQRDNWKHQ